MTDIKKYTPLTIFCVYFAKIAIQPSSSYPEALILLILGSIAGYFEYKHQSGRMESMEQQINQINKDMQEKLRDIEALKSSMASLKLQNGMRTVNTR